MQRLSFVLAAVLTTAAAATANANAALLPIAINASSSTAALTRIDQRRRRLADATCSIAKDIDDVGNDIGSAAAALATDCCLKCGAKSGCNAFTWTDYSGGTCWFKSSASTAVAKSGAMFATLSAAATPAPAPATCSIQAGVDYVGNDIGNTAGATAADCCAKCSSRVGCGAFSWTNMNGGTCWLKSGKGSTVSNTNVYSSVVNTATAAACPTVEQGVDYIGNDIGNAAGSGASDCCTKCSQRVGCGAFTWTSFNGGTCWLKSSKGATAAKTGSVSAVVLGNSSPTPAPPGPTPAPAPSTHIQTRLRSGEIPTRSVNLGGWLVAEYWMSFTSMAWTDTNGVGWDGEYLTMKLLGKTKGTAQFEQHRATWYTEADIQELAKAGLNTVRVPVGFWIVNDDPSTVANDISRVYAAGSLKYLDKVINEWGVKYNLAVMVSLHAHQGSQNGYDHSAPQVKGTTSWSNSQANVDNSLQLATFIAARYKNSVAFLGMNLMNEPAYPTNYDVLWAYYKEAYRRIRATGNNCILAVSPMISEQSPPVMMQFMRYPEYTNVWHEFHTYYKWGYEGQSEWQIINAAKTYRATHLDNWAGNWVYMGEWSLAHPDEAPFTDLNLLKQFAASQLEQFQGAHAGWAFWSWRHDEETQRLSGWSMRQLLRAGIFTVPKV